MTLEELRSRYLQGPWDGAVPPDVAAAVERRCAAADPGEDESSALRRWINAELMIGLVELVAEDGFCPAAAYEASKSATWIGPPPADAYDALFSVADGWLIDERALFGDRPRPAATGHLVWPELQARAKETQRP